jgi:adenylate cyclase
MAFEIERKFLVSKLPGDLGREQRIEQGYFQNSGDSNVGVRLRRIDGEESFLTIKGGTGIKRVEIELPLTSEQFEALWPLTEGKRLRKKRFKLPLSQGLKIDLDVYEGHLSELVTAEVEFPSEEEAAGFSSPPWFDREVTGDPAYLNYSLAGKD